LERTGGLALGFGWNARGTLWQAAARTPAAAVALAEVIRTLRRIDPRRPIDAMAHSLGARVTLAALQHLDPGDVGRVLLLSPADLRPHAEAALATPAGQWAEVVNVTCRANAMFDFCVETLLSARLQTSVAQGLSKPAQNWTDLTIDDPATEKALARLGYPLRPASVRICHWQPYLRPGLFALYRALFARDLAPAQLRAAVAQSSGGPHRPALPLTGVPA
jgi:pimeloyl-ACP methyl ester carboxylesterase